MIVQILAPTNWNIHFIEQEIQGAWGLLLNDDAENMNSKEKKPYCDALEWATSHWLVVT